MDMSNYKYPTPQLLLKAICDTIRAKTGSTNKIAHQNIPDELNNIARTEYYEEQIENISSIYTGTNLNFSISNNDIKSIAEYKFYGSGLTTVNLPKCTSIGQFAFKNCTRLTTVDLPECASIGSYAFDGCTNLTTVNLPEYIYIESSAFYDCTNLTTVNLPKCTTLGYQIFKNCTNLTTIDLPECASIGGYAFSRCTSLTTVDLPECASIEGYAFSSCTNLTTIILSNNQIVTLKDTRAFHNTPIANGTGYIYVPDNLVDSYKSDNNWSTYANQIKPLSELPSNLKEEYGYD